jgi:1-deoxy-D-xylulose-5-phosphate reductoisomerase
MAGPLVMRLAAERGATLLPVDSEHSAIHQALRSGTPDEVTRVILTASGGPFRSWPLAAIRNATLEQALKHPNWSMGPKITIDSATMMNKGLEVIEAARLFALPPERIEVLVHPQSAVHGLVQFADGSLIAQLGTPDMRTPIAHALAWPKRMAVATPRLDLAALARLEFFAPDPIRFPALRLAREALHAGGGAPTILNAANEVAVARFLDRRLGFLDIARVVEAVLSQLGAPAIEGQGAAGLATIIALDAEARRVAGAHADRRARLG